MDIVLWSSSEMAGDIFPRSLVMAVWSVARMCARSISVRAFSMDTRQMLTLGLRVLDVEVEVG